ncbi:unnamed protein product [Oppiella nova]|uniref:DET1-like protein n=1 Tax=Oppiella nova TaxID=334625 RepID=A0A7R9LCA5_9ACAR|nr:unnamed protein product [Oppiella nova]CAG2162147.1 unnamed protein product [Oppiella nova]
MCKKCEIIDTTRETHNNSLGRVCSDIGVKSGDMTSKAKKRGFDAIDNNRFTEAFTEWEGIKRRRICPQNVVIRLLRREVSFGGTGRTGRCSVRALHQNIAPNFTVVNIEKPNCFLRKFTPDGRFLLAFSADQTCIEIYQYMGPSAASHLLKDIPSSQEFTCNGNDEQSVRLKSKVFETFFKLRHVVTVTTNGEQLNRECSLFTDDSRYVIVGSAAFVADEVPPIYFDIYRNNESVSPNARSPLEDYSLHLVDIISGRVCDKRVFKTDKIFLSHNQGIYLYDNTLAVLSVQHQTIHVFHISKEGQFIDAKSIGRFCHEDDEFLVSSAMASERSASTGRHQTPVRPFREVTINALKHRLMVFLYRKAELESQLKGNYLPIRRFYQNFDQFCSLRVWKMQLLDENHLLLKYASEEVITSRLNDINSSPSLFVVYNMITSCVIAVFENTSEELLQLFESFCDLYRNCSLRSPAQLICSPSNNIHSRLLQQRFKQTIINARNGGHTEAIRRLLAQLPISAQSYTCSPYLDLSLFSYDDKWISVMERPKACGDHPIRFYARDSGILRRFYQNFDQFCSLRVWKMQLLDENHLLLKYASEEVITSRLNDINSSPSLFVVYNMITSCVIAVFENTSEELLQLFESFCDLYRNCSLRSPAQLICSPSNNIHSRLLQQRFKQTIINARNGGHTEAIRRLLAQLPISAQSYTCSPYLDLSLFSYDDKWISVMERPKACGDHPIRFYARDSGILRFKIYAGLQNRTSGSVGRRLVAFTLHPTDPLLISVQRTNTEYVVNLHVRHSNPI